MSDKAREFWLSNIETDYDQTIYTYDYKITGSVHVIEYSAYEAAIKERGELKTKYINARTSGLAEGMAKSIDATEDRDKLVAVIEWAIKTWNSGVTQEEVFNKLRKALNDTNGKI